MDITAAIAKQREALSAPKTWKVDVVCGGEIFTVELEKLHPDTWDALVSANPPRPAVADDQRIGYNQHAVTAKYPVKVDGEEQPPEKWSEFVSVLDSVHRNNLALMIWNANVFEPIEELKALGKARAGKK